MRTSPRKFGGADRLPHVALGVLRDMDDETDHGSGQVLASDGPRFGESGWVYCPDDGLGLAKRVLDESQQFLTSGACRYVLRVQDGHLFGGERGALQVGHQPAGAAGDVPEMKSHGPESMRRAPNLLGGEPLEAAAQVFARLLEAEEERGDERVHAADRSTEPRLR